MKKLSTHCVLVFVYGAAIAAALVADLYGNEEGNRDKRLNALEKINSCSSTGIQTAVSALTKNLNDCDESVVENAINILEGIGPEAEMAVPALNQIVRSGSPKQQLSAIKALAEIKSKEAIPALNTRLRDEDGDISHAAARALDAIFRYEMPELLRVFKERERYLRVKTIEFIDQFGIETVIGASGSMKKKNTSEVSRAIHDSLNDIIAGLEKHGSAFSSRALRRYLESAPSSRLRARAAYALGKIEGAGALELLRSLQALETALASPQWLVRRNARQSLQRLGHRAEKCDSMNEDWPMWRRDPARTAAGRSPLPDRLHLQWKLELPVPQRAWPRPVDDYDRLDFDLSYSPVSDGDHLFVGSMVDDSIRAYNMKTGRELWHYVTDGPVRLPPLYHDGRIYAVSDDGYIYCLESAGGELLWRHRGGPSDRLVLGNGRLISLWSARGGPVMADGVLYFAAGIWPAEGVFVHALDPVTGDVLWSNSRLGTLWDSDRGAFGTVAPQGALTVADSYLLVPGGRTLPAVLNRDSGELMHYAGGLSRHGGHQVYAGNDVFFNAAEGRMQMYKLADSAPAGLEGVQVIADGAYFGIDRDAPFTYLDDVVPVHIVHDAVDGLQRLHLLADDRLYGSGKGGRIFALSTDRKTAKPSIEVIWEKEVEGEVCEMIAASGRLVVVTKEGSIFCFGERKPDEGPTVHRREPPDIEHSADQWEERVTKLLSQSNAQVGYAVMVGIGSGRLLEELVHQSDLHITAFDPDKAVVKRMRKRFLESEDYGRRVTVHHGDLSTWEIPAYIAELIVSEDASRAIVEADGNRAWPEQIYRILRPYGGMAYLTASDKGEKNAIEQQIGNARLTGERMSSDQGAVIVVREGPPAGAGEWSHQYGDAANTAYSSDERVQAPMGLSWFGGPSNERTLPDAMGGPVPQVAGGRMVIMGADHISTRCVYTGRQKWSVELESVGEFFTSSEHEARQAGGEYYVEFPHAPGAAFIGSPYITLPDSVYVIHNDRCLKLDAESGEQIAGFDLPSRKILRELAGEEASYAERIVIEKEQKNQNSDSQKHWGVIRIWDDYLVAGAYPHFFDDERPGRSGSWNMTSSEFIVTLDRHSGEIKWVRGSSYGFRHNAIAVGDGRVYVIDNLSPRIHERLAREGLEPDRMPEIRAIDIETGEVLWRHDGLDANLELDGTGGHVDTGVNAGQLGIEGNAPRTIELWAYVREIKREGLFSLGTIGSSEKDFSLRGRRNGEWRVQYWGRADFDFSWPVENQWVHFALVHTGEKSIVYVDGEKAASAYRELNTSPDGSFRIGIWRNSGFQGMLRDVRIWNVARTKSEIRENMHESLSGEEENLLGLWKLNEGHGTVARDSTPEGNDGRIKGGFWGEAFGTWLSYSSAHSLLLQSGRRNADGPLEDEPDTRVSTLDAHSGEELWRFSGPQARHTGPVALHEAQRRTIPGAAERSFDLPTGRFAMTANPISGESEYRKCSRSGSVGSHKVSRNLVTFQSGSAGYHPLYNMTGTGNLSGFSIGHIHNLVAADGVMVAPAYRGLRSRGDQHRTSVGLQHMPDGDMWQYSNFSTPDASGVRRVGINFGAPGVRRSADGLLWLPYPRSSGLDAPSISFQLKKEKEAEWFQLHSLAVKGGNYPWVFSQGVEAIRSIRLDGLSQEDRSYRLRFYFMEPDVIKKGERAFSIVIQDDKVIKDYDIIRDAAGRLHGTVEEIPGIIPDEAGVINIEFEPSQNTHYSPVICGLEIWFE